MKKKGGSNLKTAPLCSSTQGWPNLTFRLKWATRMYTPISIKVCIHLFDKRVYTPISIKVALGIVLWSLKAIVWWSLEQSIALYHLSLSWTAHAAAFQTSPQFFSFSSFPYIPLAFQFHWHSSSSMQLSTTVPGPGIILLYYYYYHYYYYYFLFIFLFF